MYQMFQEIWESSPHRSEISGTWLGDKISSGFFHHILPKESYSEYTLCKENIIMVTLDEHHDIHADMPKLEKFPKVRELYLFLLEKHRNFEEIN